MAWLFGHSNKDESSEFIKVKFEDLEDVLEKAGMESEKVTDVVDSLYNKLGDKVQEKTLLDYDEFSAFASTNLADIYYRGTNSIQRAQQLSKFIEDNSDVGGSIRLYASYITYGAADIQLDEYKVVLSGKDTDKVKSATELVNSFEDTTKIKRLIYQLAKDLVSFGDAYLEKIYDKDGKLIGLAYIPTKSVYVQLDDKGVPIAYYQFLDKMPKEINQSMLFTYETKKQVIKFMPNEIAHFNDGSVIGFSDSTVNNLLVQCRFMKLLEETLIIHRITRARRFIVFFLDVTGKTKEKIRRAVRNFTNTIKKMFTLNIHEGQIESERSITPSISDLVIPVTKDNATKVQTIPSDPSATKIDDLKFYSGKITQALLTSHVFGQEKSSKDDYIQQAFFRMVRIYQKQISFILKDIYEEVLEQAGYDDLRISVIFPSPDPTVELKIIDSVVRRMMVVNQLIATTGIVPPNNWIVEYVFKDMTMIETEQLINMLNYAQKEQNKAAEGNEYPTIFEGEDEDNEENTNNAFQTSNSNTFSLNDNQNNTEAGTQFFNHLFDLKSNNAFTVQEKYAKEYLQRTDEILKLSMQLLNKGK